MLVEAVSAASAILAFLRRQPFQRGKWRSTHWLIFTQLLFFPAIVAVGALFPAASGRPYPKENLTGKWLLDALFYLSLITAAIWLYRMKGLRWLTASLLMLQQAFLIGAGFIAGMSVSGDWI
jgi:hypothetical protein